MQPTQSILDLEIEGWRGSTAAVHPTAGTSSYFDEISFGNGAQHRSSPVDLPPMISMSSPFINNSYQKQQQYNSGQHHMHIGTLHHPPNAHSHHQQQYDPVPAHHHAHNYGQHHYDMDVDSVYHSTYSNSYGQQHQVDSPTLSSPLSSQHHIQGNLGQQRHEAAAVCDPRFVSGHHDFFSPLQHHTTVNGASGNTQDPSTTSSNQGSKPSSPANVDGHADVQNPRVKLEGDVEDLVYPSNDSSFSPLPHPQPLTVVIPSSTNSLHDLRLSAMKRKFSSASDTYQSELFDPGYSLTSAVRVEINGRIGVVSPTALISPLERTDLDLKDREGDNEAYSDADGDSEECEYDYDDSNDSEFVPRSRPSVARRISHQHLSTQPPQHPSEQAWLSVSGRRRAATNPSIAVPQTYQPQPSYAWGYSHDDMRSSLDGGFSSNGSGVVRSRSGTTAGMDHTHRYNPYQTGGYTYDGHSTAFDSSALYGDDLTYHTQPSYPPSLDLDLPSLRSRRASTSTSTTSTTTPNTPLTPLTPLSAADGDLGVSQVGVHVHGYATRSGGVSHAYSPSSTSAYDSSPNSSQMGSLGANGMEAGSKRRSRPSTSLPVPVPVPNLTKKSRGRRVPTVYHSSLSNGSSNHKGARIHMCKVPGCGKCFARGEHLKRHVRSIHTYEKPHKCPYPGCGKDFSRHDNLGQHMRVHKDFDLRV